VRRRRRWLCEEALVVLLGAAGASEEEEEETGVAGEGERGEEEGRLLASSVRYAGGASRARGMRGEEMLRPTAKGARPAAVGSARVGREEKKSWLGTYRDIQKRHAWGDRDR
jgi:hypothetical protein